MCVQVLGCCHLMCTFISAWRAAPAHTPQSKRLRPLTCARPSTLKLQRTFWPVPRLSLRCCVTTTAAMHAAVHAAMVVHPCLQTLHQRCHRSTSDPKQHKKEQTLLRHRQRRRRACACHARASARRRRLQLATRSAYTAAGSGRSTLSCTRYFGLRQSSSCFGRDGV